MFVKLLDKILAKDFKPLEIKEIRDQLLKIISNLNEGDTFESDMAIEKLTEGRMWLGLLLGKLGQEDLNRSRDNNELRIEYNKRRRELINKNISKANKEKRENKKLIDSL